jgi:hypothetical protein
LDPVAAAVAGEKLDKGKARLSLVEKQNLEKTLFSSFDLDGKGKYNGTESDEEEAMRQQ